MIGEKSVSFAHHVLLFVPGVVLVLCLPAPVAAGGWEEVKEFYGTITILQVLDHEADLGDQKQILRKNVSATISVTGHSFDGAYHRPVGTISGTITTESFMISKKDGKAVHGTFSGVIDQRFDGENLGGPGLKVNKQEGLYRISLPHLYAKGTATVTVPGLGTSDDPDSEEDAKPFMPPEYRKPVRYEPQAGVIIGGFTHPEKIPTYPKPMVVTTTASWNLSFEMPPLRAEAGEAQTVERGEKVTLDGSGSTGRIVTYTWTFEKDPKCMPGPDAHRGEKMGANVEVTVLCSLTARLTVSDGSDEESDTTTITVNPRDWKTEFYHDPDEGILDPSVRPLYSPYLPAFNGGANSCLEDGQSTSDNHIMHPAATDGTWEGRGYSLFLVDDHGGPFDGFWYPSEYNVRVTRETLLNKYIVEGGPVLLAGLKVSFYDKNKVEGTDIDGYLQAVRDHELNHSLHFENWLRTGDPAADIEKAVGQERDALKEEIDGILQKAESEICHAGKDPFSINWGGELWFGKDDGSGWILGETEVGGENQLQIKCP